jgi:tRNA modification GTPase
LVLVNKCDLPWKLGEGWCEGGTRVLRVSAKSGEGLDSVREAIRRELVSASGDAHHAVVVTSVRHGTALRKAAEALEHGLESAKHGFPSELITVDLRAAADALGEITGSISTDDVLERIFSSFCIGK